MLKDRICHFEENFNMQFTYFCGSAPECQSRSDGNFDAIQRAKFNVESYFSVVGLSHDLKRSFELMESLLPLYFDGRSNLMKSCKYLLHV